MAHAGCASRSGSPRSSFRCVSWRQPEIRLPRLRLTPCTSVARRGVFAEGPQGRGRHGVGSSGLAPRGDGEPLCGAEGGSEAFGAVVLATLK